MSDVRWDMLAQYPNPGQAFSQAFQEGQKQAEERRAKEAIAALVGNPQDPKALETAARYDPKLVIDLRQQQAEASIKQVEQYRDQIKIGAQLVRQIQPKDQAGWEQVLNAARQYRIDPDQLGVPRQFDPSYVQNLVALGDALEPKNQAQDNIVVIDGVAFDKTTGQPLFESPYPKVVSGPGGIYVQDRVGYGRQPGQAVPQGRAVDGVLPPGWKFEDEGDASGNAGGGFRDPLAPL